VKGTVSCNLGGGGGDGGWGGDEIILFHLKVRVFSAFKNLSLFN
jgi:hypothetical protein